MTNAEARFYNSLRPRKPEGSLGRTAQDVHLDCHTAPELCYCMCYCYDPFHLFFPALFLFDWVGVLWPQLSKVLKPVRWARRVIVQKLCESRGGRPELSVLTSLLVSVDVKNY